MSEIENQLEQLEKTKELLQREKAAIDFITRYCEEKHICIEPTLDVSVNGQKVGIRIRALEHGKDT